MFWMVFRAGVRVILLLYIILYYYYILYYTPLFFCSSFPSLFHSSFSRSFLFPSSSSSNPLLFQSSHSSSQSFSSTIFLSSCSVLFPPPISSIPLPSLPFLYSPSQYSSSLPFLSHPSQSISSIHSQSSHSKYTCRHLDILIYIILFNIPNQQSDPAQTNGVDG